jgi:hypothetical protein
MSTDDGEVVVGIHVGAYIDPSVDNLIHISPFPVTVDGQQILVEINGSYEVA